MKRIFETSLTAVMTGGYAAWCTYFIFGAVTEALSMQQYLWLPVTFLPIILTGAVFYVQFFRVGKNA